MKEAFGHKPCKEHKERSYAKVSNGKLKKLRPKHLEFIKAKKEVRKLDICRQFLIDETSAGIILAELVAEGKLKMLPRKAREHGVWVLI